jgi:hypothetical protein
MMEPLSRFSIQILEAGACTRLSRPTAIIAVAVAMLLPCTREARAHDKTDVVTLKNGDRVTCEIKSLSQGRLQVKTSDMGSFSIEWGKIDSLESSYFHRAETKDGKRHYGRPSVATGGSVFSIKERGKIVALRTDDVVALVPLETRSFWAEQNGSLSIGFSFTKASEVSQLTLTWNNLYRTRLNRYDLSVSSIVTDNRAGDELTSQYDASFTYSHLLRAKWIGGGTLALQRNDELGLARRILVGLGTGAEAIQSNKQVLQFTVGLTLNSELPQDSTATSETIEGVLSVDYSRFVYDTPKTNLNTSLQVYPSLTGSRRYRAQFSLDLNKELFKNFFLSINYNTSYDSDAPSGKGTSIDYSIVTSIGYSYGV